MQVDTPKLGCLPKPTYSKSQSQRQLGHVRTELGESCLLLYLQVGPGTSGNSEALVPVERVVYDILSNVQKKFSRDLLKVIFSKTHLKAYPEIRNQVHQLDAEGCHGFSRVLPGHCLD